MNKLKEIKKWIGIKWFDSFVEEYSNNEEGIEDSYDYYIKHKNKLFKEQFYDPEKEIIFSILKIPYNDLLFADETDLSMGIESYINYIDEPEDCWLEGDYNNKGFYLFDTCSYKTDEPLQYPLDELYVIDFIEDGKLKNRNFYINYQTLETASEEPRIFFLTKCDFRDDGECYYEKISISNIPNKMKIIKLEDYLQQTIETEHKKIEKLKKSIIAKGKCGENLSWEIQGYGKEKKLVISGRGDMCDFYDWKQNCVLSTPPWTKYSWELNEIIIENGVTSIGCSAFANEVWETEDEDVWGLYDRITKFVLPDTLQRINNNSCSGLYNLKEINNFHHNIKIIEDDAFFNCKNLKRNIVDIIGNINNKAIGCYISGEPCYYPYYIAWNRK